MKNNWCTFPPEILGDCDYLLKRLDSNWGFMHSPRPKNRYIRCPKCNKRLLVQWYDCGDGDCWHPKISKHKEK